MSVEATVPSESDEIRIAQNLSSFKHETNRVTRGSRLKIGELQRFTGEWASGVEYRAAKNPWQHLAVQFGMPFAAITIRFTGS